MRRIIILRFVLAFAGIALAGCSGSSDSGGMGNMDMGSNSNTHEKNTKVVAGAREIAVDAMSFEFTPSNLQIKASEDITIALSSMGGLHDFVVQGIGHVVGANAGKTAMGGLRIDTPGTYKFWCSVVGHRAQGMKGTITVT